MQKVGKFIVKCTNWLLGVIFVGLMILLFVNVFMRNFFHNAIPWAEEVTLYGLVAIVFLGMPLLSMSNKHIRVDLIYNSIKPETKDKLQIFSLWVEMFIALVIGIPAAKLAYEVYKNNQISPAALIPVWLINLLLPVGFFLSIILMITTFVIKKSKTKSDDVKIRDVSF